MLVLELEFLSGRFYGSDPTDRSVVEWPPHPSRLFFALVAMHHAEGGDPLERKALEWLESQGAPRIAASDATRRTAPVVYVPINDPKANKPEVIPTDRTRKERCFPSATPIDPFVRYIWPSQPDTDLLSALKRLCQRVVCVGHSTSLARISIAANSPKPNWVPDPKGRHSLRTPVGGLLTALEESYSQHQGLRPRNLPTGFTLYRNESPEEKVLEPHLGVWDQGWVGVRISPRASLRSALALTEAFRGALMSLGPQPSPPWLAGHEPDGKPTHQPHLAVIPLADVGHRHARGMIMGMAAVMPRALGLTERAILFEIISTMRVLTVGGSRFEVEALEDRPDRWSLDVRNWVGPSLEWASVTPVVLDRFPKDPFGEEAEQIIRRSCRDIGLLEPLDVSIQVASPHLGVPEAKQFPARRRIGRPSRWHSHVILRFPEPVRGPVLLGAGRHYGYGLFKPWRRS